MKIIANHLFFAVVASLASCVGVTESDLNRDRGLVSGSSENDLPKRGDSGKATLVTDVACTISSDLFGIWTVDKELAERLIPDELRRDVVPSSIEFRRNPAIETEVLKALDDYVVKLERAEAKNLPNMVAELKVSVSAVYTIGEVEWTPKKGAAVVRKFALVHWRGNMALFILRPEGRFDIQYMGVARDANGDNDILMLTEDSRSSSSLPLRRKQ